jgi:SpoVK/Ycf46/Vps4 family AAA+-type ATPase
VIDVDRPGNAEQRAAWIGALGPTDVDAVQINRVASQFTLPVAAINAAAADALEFETVSRLKGSLGDDEPDPEAAARLGDALWDAARRQARPMLEDLAVRIEPVSTWDDLVVPDSMKETLRTVVLHVRHRDTVYEDWGVAGKSARGLGISVLFTGPSGTGKTMAAEVLASELRLELYRIDLSSVVSKYIGETEKNLRRVFDAAEEGGAILLFDEADALFGRRSEVKDSHDRYANIEVAYLLQRMEAYGGLAILTTNLEGALDPAFLRRIRFVLRFPFPDAALRKRIWEGVFPKSDPKSDRFQHIDPVTLARLSLTGGSIRNIALDAAFRAASEGESVQMRHLASAARSECEKLGKPLGQAEIGEWR